MAKETGEAAKSRAADLTEKAKSEASDVAEAATEKARDYANDRVETAKSYASGEIDKTADRVRNAAREFGEDGYPAQAADYLADNLHQAADALRSADVGSVVDDLSQFARRNPAVFLGAAALLGFAAARVMKASERQRGRSNADYDRAYGSGRRYAGDMGQGREYGR